ncbi:MAG TPA: AAA family ATPase [Nocardioides sp.]|nr:AAA family ATPase [Nocardioides sp.]
MPGPKNAALLLGRDREVAVLDGALDAASQGVPQTILVGGDAGIGKTTLMTHVGRHAADRGFEVVVGHCLDLEANISFAPVVEAVRALLSTVEELEARPSARRMLTLLDPEAPSTPEPFRILADLRQTVLEAAALGPVMLVLEDMHWGDRSTQDFVSSLSRTASGRLLFVLTFRSDELHRRHPLRLALAELGRAPGTTRLDLGALDRDSIVGIVAAHAGCADDSLVDTVLARSEGNPLYAEELVHAAQQRIPEPLADLFLTRVDALGEEVRGLLRLASVNGSRLDTATLPALAGLAPERIDALLREAVDANLLCRTADSLEFRHGLLREAVYDDLMPDERTRLHADLATILQASVDAAPDPGVSMLSRLAFHWSAAHSLPRTLEASVRAGLVAWKVGAAESVTHLERALSLWDRISDAEALAGRTKVELVLALARAAGDQGHAERWHALNRRAVDMLDPRTDPLVASRAYSAFGTSAMHNHDMSNAPEAIRLAIAYAGDSPTEERAYAHAAQALLHNFNGRFADGLDAADRAIRAANAADSIDPLLLGLTFRAEALLHVGRLSEAPAAAELAVERARRAGMVGQALHWAGWLAGLLMDLGQVGSATSIARAAYHEAQEAGRPLEAGWCGEPLVEVLTWGGKLDAAQLVLDEMSALSPTEGPWRGRAELLLARGDADSAAQVMPSAAVYDVAVGAFPDAFDVLRELQLAVLRDDVSRCHAVAEAYLRQLENRDESPLIAAAAARIGFHALALNRSMVGPRVDELSDLSVRQLGRARDRLTDVWRGSNYGVQLALAEGYAARVAGQPGIDQFREAARLAGPFGVFFELEPRLDLAQELLAHGGRDEARELLVDCWTAAHDMGARGLERRAFRLATRTRVPLPESATSEGPLSRLTPREREVLDLLATGATNRAIAGTLFISGKTVSSHVSSLLGKLGVDNRGAAAALARQIVG